MPRACSAIKQGFDFTHHMRSLCADIVQRLPQLAHICLPAVAIAFAQTRKPGSHGLHAALTPLRFSAGSLTTQQAGSAYTLQRLYDEAGHEYLYILSFYLPRFLNLPFTEKLTTIMHELWHISPAFDGDLRRLQGRCYIHGANEKHFDATARHLAQAWLAHNPRPQTYAFLQQNYRQLVKQYGAVYGIKISAPKLIPMSDPNAAEGCNQSAGTLRVPSS